MIKMRRAYALSPSNGGFVILVLMMVVSSISASSRTCFQPRGLRPLPSNIHKKEPSTFSSPLQPKGGAIKALGGGHQIEPKKNPGEIFLYGFLWRSINKYAEDLFDKTDANSDGSLSFEEIYKLVLLISIKVNREAPITPPTEENMRILFDKADVSKSGKLTKGEFKKFLRISLPRTSTRVLAHKILSIVVAPMLAFQVVHHFSSNLCLKKLGSSLVGSKWFPEKYAKTVLSEQFWIVGLTVWFVSKLGNIVVRATTWVYDALALKSNDKFKEFKKKCNPGFLTVVFCLGRV
jgi:hypothetical protein